MMGAVTVLRQRGIWLLVGSGWAIVVGLLMAISTLGIDALNAAIAGYGRRVLSWCALNAE